MGSEPNRSAAVHLCAEILPRLRGLRPDAGVVIAGADPAPEVTRLASLPGVRVTGRIDDPRPLLAACRTAVLPLRAASGIRSRACELMGLEVPVVAYEEALDGMGFEPGRDYLRAADPDSFAEAIARLLGDPMLVKRITASARNAVAVRYGIAATYGRFVALYDSLLAR
jgi:glycosyltransferase involved in cell wall biosynthesis